MPRPEVQPGAIAVFDSLRRAHMVAQEVYEVSRDRRTVAHGSLSYFTGRHDLKAGFQWDNGRYFAENFSTSGMRAVFRNGVPDSVNTYNTPVSRTSYVQDTAMFVQDKWSATRKLTINLGLRIEKFRGWQPEVCQVQTQFVAGQCFAAHSRMCRTGSIRRRGSASIYDIHGDGRAAIKVGASRYNIGTATGHIDRVNPVSVTNDTRVRGAIDQRRSHPAAERARAVDRIQFRHDQSL